MGRGLSELQHRIMADIAGREHVLVRELIEHNAGHSPQAISRAVTRLVLRGKVERVQVEEDGAPRRQMAVREPVTVNPEGNEGG